MTASSAQEIWPLVGAQSCAPPGKRGAEVETGRGR